MRSPPPLFSKKCKNICTNIWKYQKGLYLYIVSNKQQHKNNNIMTISGNTLIETKVTSAHGYTMVTAYSVDNLTTKVTAMFNARGEFVKINVMNASASGKVWRSMGKDFTGVDMVDAFVNADKAYKSAKMRALIEESAHAVAAYIKSN